MSHAQQSQQQDRRITQTFADHAMALTFEALPEDVVEVGKHCMLDWIGVTLAGLKEPLTQILIAQIAADGGTPQATLIGDGRKVNMAQAALIKGGHAQAEANDFLHSASERCSLPGTRSGVGPVHGTGCALSAAITARLAQGAALGDAVRTAKAFVTGAIEHSFAPGRGQRLLAGRSATGAHPELRSPGST